MGRWVSGQRWLIKAEPLKGKVVLPVAVFAVRPRGARAGPPGGLSVTDGAVVASSVKGFWRRTPQSSLLNSMN